MKRRNTHRGLTLLELVIYFGILSFLSTGVVYAILGLVSTYQRVGLAKEVERSGMVAMDRISREIRNASSISSISTSTLQLSSPTGTGTYTVEFSLNAAGVIRVSENGVDAGPLTTGNASTTQLIFTQITTPHSSAVKVLLTVRASSSRFVRTANFYDTIILRGSY